MGMVIVILGAVIALIGAGCYLYLVYEAFQDEAWKGILGFFVSLYLLYYALVEFEHDQKWLIVLGAIFGGGFGGFLIGAGMSMMR
jgi:hypothetical protein